MSDPRRRLAELLARCHDDPGLFNHVFLKRPPYWWRQVEICESVARYKTTVVVSGNAVGKDYALGGILPWWLWTRYNSLAFLTGPSQTVLGSVTWKEIRRSIAGSHGGLLDNARVSAGAKASPLSVDLGNGWQALGYSTTSIERASGLHAARMLAVVEEASGVEDDAFEAIDGLNPERKLVIGNPLRGEGAFKRLAERGIAERGDPSIPDHERVNTIVIPSTDSPDIRMPRSERGLADLGFLVEAERTYGKDSLWWACHVAASFPGASAGGLTPEFWVDRMAGVIEHVAGLRRGGDGGTRYLGADLGEGTGRDPTALVVRDALGILHGEESDQVGIPEAALRISKLSRLWDVRQENVIYDAGGRGRDLPRYLEQYDITEAVPYHGSGTGGRKFTNRRGRVAWRLRQRLDPERPVVVRPRLDPGAERSPFDPDPETVARPQPPFAIPPDHPWWPRLSMQIKELRYRLDGKKIALETKAEMMRRIGQSPDILDALLMTFDYEMDS